MEPVDWVAKRASCTGAEVFVRLKASLKRDVDIRNAQMAGRGPSQYVWQDDGQFVSVLLKRPDKTIHVSFTYENPDKTIHVSFTYENSILRASDGETGAVIAEASVMLSGGSAGCVLRMVNPAMNMPVEEWYFRYLALDKLFFDTPFYSHP